jgi:hypothetical protein
LKLAAIAHRVHRLRGASGAGVYLCHHACVSGKVLVAAQCEWIEREGHAQATSRYFDMALRRRPSIATSTSALDSLFEEELASLFVERRFGIGMDQ